MELHWKYGARKRAHHINDDAVEKLTIAWVDISHFEEFQKDWSLAQLNGRRHFIRITFWGSDDLEENSGGRDDGAPSSCCELYNILLVGDSGVGKTDLIGRLGEEEFKTKFHATIGK